MLPIIDFFVVKTYDLLLKFEKCLIVALIFDLLPMDLRPPTPSKVLRYGNAYIYIVL